jgi:RimJ/RimL family protein N-acetyltransferase
MMVELEPGSVTLDAQRLLPPDLPTRPRALAILDGVQEGRILADRSDEPTWLVVVERLEGTVYAGGTLTAAALSRALAAVQPESDDFVIGFSGPDDPMRGLVPSNPSFRGEAIDFTDREPPADEADAAAQPAPDGLRLAELTADLLPRTEWYQATLRAYGSPEGWSERGIGRCLLAGREVAAEAMAGPRVRGLMEMGVATRGPYRRRRYATYLAQQVARACEERGDTVWWNASADNLPSQAIARRLGFRRQCRYELVAYPISAFRR